MDPSSPVTIAHMSDPSSPVTIAHMSVLMTVHNCGIQLQHRKVLIIFPFIFQTIIVVTLHDPTSY